MQANKDFIASQIDTFLKTDTNIQQALAGITWDEEDGDDGFFGGAEVAGDETVTAPKLVAQSPQSTGCNKQRVA